MFNVNCTIKMDTDKIINKIKEKALSSFKEVCIQEVQKLLLNYNDETGLKPEVVIRIEKGNQPVASADEKWDMVINVVNGDQEYRKRVADYIKENLKTTKILKQ